MSPTNELDTYIKKHLGHLFPQGMDTCTLYHYTTVDTLEVLTRKDADFICTYCAAMNDSAEFSIGIKLIKDYMGRHPGTLDEEMGAALATFSSNPSFASWSMSFSRDGDSLNQWISYTDRTEGGVAIGFDLHDLNQRVHDLKNKCGLMYVVPCLYVGEHDKEIEDLLDFLFGEYRASLCSTIDRKSRIKTSSSEKWISLTIALIFASMVKDGSFRGEQEWRLVMLPCDEDVVRDCEFIAGKPRLRTRLFGVDYELAQSIVDVVCSPHGHMQPKVDMIATLRKLSQKPHVSKSTYKANG